MVKPGMFAQYALGEAENGNPLPIIHHLKTVLQGGAKIGPLSDGEIQFIERTLEATTRHKLSDEDRLMEQWLIAKEVADLTNKGMPLKSAVAEIMVRFHRSRRHVFNAIAANKNIGKKRRG